MVVNLNPLPPKEQNLAALYGRLVSTAYDVYDNNLNNPIPPWPSPLPGNYEFVAWVQMQDFFIWEGAYTFYGLIARSPSAANEYVLAIRGTSDYTEWWDDFRSLGLTTLPNFGNETAQVGYGFYTIYKTLRVVYPLQLVPPSGVTPSSVSLETAGSFANQVAAAVRRHIAETTPPGTVRPEALGATASITVAGHSLGSALATLYVAENSGGPQFKIPLLCTLASPRVGDPTFATQFDALPGLASWRIVNYPDLVPTVPAELAGFQHVEMEYLYDSGWSTLPFPECWHSIDTYLNLLDPNWQIAKDCQWSWLQMERAALRAKKGPAPAVTALAAPAQKEIAVTAPAGTTINITIKVG